MAKLIGKFISDNAIDSQHLAATAKQSVLESKLSASRRGVLAFSSTAASSNVVTTGVLAAALTDTPVASLAAKGIYTGTISGSTDLKKVLIRQAGTDQGIADGNGDEVYGVLSEATGVYTLSYKKANGTAHTMAAESIDFYFVEVYDLYNMPADASLYQGVSGVIDADQATTIAGHLNGGANKHDASEIDTEGTYTNITGTDLATLLVSIDTDLGTKAEDSVVTEIDGNVNDLITLSGVAENATDLGTFTGATIPDSSTNKGALQALETEVETKAASSVVTEIDANVDDLVTLSGVDENATDLGTFTGSTIADAQTVKAALQALETEVETKAASSVVTEIDGNVNDLVTLSGVAENATDLGTFTGTTIADAQTVKAALQSLESAVEGITSETEHVEYFTLIAGDITNKYVDLTNVPKAANNVRMMIKGAPAQFYGDDFTVITNGSAIKRVNWDSLGLDGVLAIGDKLTLVYSV